MISEMAQKGGEFGEGGREEEEEEKEYGGVVMVVDQRVYDSVICEA